jgi:DNA ligase-1
MAIIYYDGCDACAQRKWLNDDRTDLEAANPSVIKHTCILGQERKASTSMETHPILFHMGANGLQQWRVWTVGATIFSEHGLVDGAKVSHEKVCESKNVGRSNETTPEAQAVAEAAALWVHKRERKYTEDPAGTKTDIFLPMLAPNDKWPETKKHIKYPAFLQPKLDGNRSVGRLDGDEAVLTSREGKPQDFLPHINAELKALGLSEDYFLDGELYCHGQSLQTINSWIKKARPESMQIKYHIYDLPVVNGKTDLSLADRLANLDQLFLDTFDGKCQFLELVPTEIVNNEEEVMTWFKHYRDLGYEGVMVKNTAGKYKQKSRSKDVAKVKPFEDAEFKVVGFTGMEVYKDEVLWICETKEGRTFKVTPNGSREQRKEWFATADQYIGRILTVTFMGYTEDGIPNIAKGKAFRLESDLPKESAA